MPNPPGLVDLLNERAQARPDRIAYRLHTGGSDATDLSYAALRGRARDLAQRALDGGARAGDRVLLIFPPGLDFIVGFFACLTAGLVAVPVLPPRREGRHDASAAIMADCGARLAFSTSALVANQRSDLAARLAAAGLAWLPTDTQPGADTGGLPEPPGGDRLALLQYTSGSTALPKGAMITHAVMMANLEMIRIAFGNSEASTTVSWVPLHHDMGLFLNALQAFYAGATCVLMAPVAFLQRPLSWLRAIHDHGAVVAGGPNFAYDLCVSRFRPEQMEGVNLSNWRVAFNGAEPVRATTMERFSRTFAPYGFAAGSHYPCYGMAEATVLASGGARGEGARILGVDRDGLRAGHATTRPADDPRAILLAGCGRAVRGSEIAIVDPESRLRMPVDSVGEIWLRGAHVAAGYWEKPDASAETFRASMVGDERPWLRTGDLGFLDAAGELYVTGRIKDVIIIRGVNHYPQDIEHTMQRVHPALRPGHGAAFGIDKAGVERVIVVQEVERSGRHGIDVDAVIADIREAVAEAHEVSLAEVILVRPGTVPRTTSGKIQRRLTRQLWSEGRIEPLAADGQPKRAT